MVSGNEDAETSSTRKGDRAWYFWQYPNLMINCYAGYMDTNLVLPLDVDHCRVIFDFFFSDVSEAAREYNEQSVKVSDRVQVEDLDICEAVQRGLKSRAYGAGRYLCGGKQESICSIGCWLRISKEISSAQQSHPIKQLSTGNCNQGLPSLFFIFK
jgi:phenylpropionate dioxygenase-like ring-hydroxylating dioxygenase large terminal subunit